MTKETVMATSARDIGDTVAAAGTFNTLSAAVTAADLGGRLKATRPFPRFALIDDAVAKLSPGMVESLVKLRTRKS
jgi:uncharacterized surface protein with fasciclin (FAS1) repeats